ncbi:MAG: NAD(P)/FAD-dependent oxidoreductase [Sulfitobacter sp.]
MTYQFANNRYDAIIIGARCAGAATGMLMARNGAKVLIVDREKEIHDTLSTHALMRPAVTLLDQWGLLPGIQNDGTPAVRSTHFHYGDERIDVPIKPCGNAIGLYAPRRWLLDRVLRDAAEDAGAEVHGGTNLVSVAKAASGRIVGADLRHPDGTVQRVFCDLLIGADGRRSTVAESVGARIVAQSPDRSAAIYTYVDGLPNQGYRWYYGDQVTAGLIPTTHGMHCLFVSCKPDTFTTRFGKDAFGGMLQILATWAPEIAADLKRRGPAEKIRRFPGAAGHMRDCAGPGWALVGDAGYFKDPATAHGITDAFLDANRLASAALTSPGDLRAYQRQRDQHAPTLFRLTQEIASLQWDFDRLKALHMDLTQFMKAEQDAVQTPAFATAA